MIRFSLFSNLHSISKQGNDAQSLLNRLKKTNVKRLSIATFLLGLLAAGNVFPLKSVADQTLTSHRSKMLFQLKNPIDTLAIREEKRSYDGKPFEGVVQENYFYKDQAFPAGTILRGYIKRANYSRRGARPGYAQFLIQEAVFPSGQSVALTEKNAAKGLITNKVHHPQAIVISDMFVVAGAFAAGTLAVDIPLWYATNLSNPAIFGIGLGVRAIEGMAFEATHKERAKHNAKNHGTVRRLAHGALRGTGITGLIDFSKRSPEPDLSEGAMIPIRLSKQELKILFDSAKHEVQPQTANPELLTDKVQNPFK